MKRDKATLKTYFEAGDKPTQVEFEDLIDSFAHIDQPTGYPTYKSFKVLNIGSSTATGYFCIKIPYVSTNFSITFKIYRHGNGMETYTVSGYLNQPNGWVQMFVDKTTQSPSGLPLEQITLTNANGANDFRIYVGEGTTTRFGNKIFITEAYITGISDLANPEVSGLDNFIISLESNLNGTIKGTF